MEKINIFDYETVSLDVENKALVIIDQTKLPGKIEILSLKGIKDIWEAIRLLKVRGAPAIGVAAASGVYLAAERLHTEDSLDFYQEFQQAKNYLETSRPTAVNLFWALRRMEEVVENNLLKSVAEIKELLKEEAIRIHDEDIEVCRKIGEYALELVKPGDGLLTHCNAGRLAAVKYGTATAPMYLGKERGYDFHIFVDETRPLLQGARLTAFELQAAGMDVTLICDNMSASIMQKGLVQAVFVGCDRVAANGDTANKIGTSVLACVAKQYHVPLYICAPTSTIDMTLETGDEIPIEERSAREVTEMWYQTCMAPDSVKVYNPSFDVTDHDLISAIITENGIARPPYKEAFQSLIRRENEG